nr:RNA-binding family protein [Ipomoea batatas]
MQEQTEKIGDGTHPCSTLFIANLGPNCTEDELRQILSQYPGFNTLKVRARGGMPVAFADFEVHCSVLNYTADIEFHLSFGRINVCIIFILTGC